MGDTARGRGRATWQDGTLAAKYGGRVQQSSIFDPAGRSYRAFRERPTSAQLATFTRWLRQAYPGAGSRANIRVFFAIMAVLILLPVMAGTASALFTALARGEDGKALAAGIGLLVEIAAGFGAARLFTKLGGPVNLGYYQLSEFARENGMQFTGVTPDPYYPGMIFGAGRTRASYGRVHSRPGERFFDIGTYRYTIGTRERQRVMVYGYMAFQIDRRLPHIVLDSLQNNVSLFGLGMSNLPASFSRDQRLSLEGDFNRYFTLYCPREYETDALYILTPDMMALLIDHSASFDVEIVDDLVFIYSPTPFYNGDENLLRRAFGVLDIVGGQTLRQTRMYSDDRTGGRETNRVAEGGRRLRRGWLTALIPIGLVVIYAIWQIFSTVMWRL